MVPYSGQDICGRFYEACRWKGPAFPMPFNGALLEIGCAEFDWLQHAETALPHASLHGIDWRGYRRKGVAHNVHTIRGDARDVGHYAPESFDWIVSISAIEHMGLGHYSADPKDTSGDCVVMANARTWLKPGGFMYLDVPWTPHEYRVRGTECRIYDEAALKARLLDGWDEWWRGWASCETPSELRLTPPTDLAGTGSRQLWMVGLWLQKPKA